MIALIAFLMATFVVSAAYESRGRRMPHLVLLGGAFVVAASLYSISVLL